MTDASFWNDQEGAQEVVQEVKLLKNWVEPFHSIDARVTSASELDAMLRESPDADMLSELDAEIVSIDEALDAFELRSLLRGEDDFRDAQLEISAGAGGTEAQDWAQMLMRMYVRWAERKGFEIDILDESEGEEAGIKGAVLEIRGAYAYGFLRPESGVHRLVRISPFDANARRQTSFAAAWVSPVIDDKIVIEILDKDVRTDTYRASGAGGQHVNKTESAIRITHVPTGIVVACQTDRSQHRNRAMAMQMLKARLYEHELRLREEKVQAANATKSEIGWGHQIRSYVLQPYQMVKDLRTNVEMGNTGAVLDGDIDSFLEAALAQKVGVGEGRAEGNA